MNKFAVFALVALFATVGSANPAPETEIVDEEDSQLPVVGTSDREETAYLKGKNQIFADFCIKSRDYVAADLKRASNNFAAQGFNFFFKSVEGIGNEALEVQRTAAERLGGQLRNPDAPIDESNQGVIAEGQERIQHAESLTRGFTTAVSSTVSATKNSLVENLIKSLNHFKSPVFVMQIAQALTEACNKVSEYDQEIRKMFDEFYGEFKSEAVANDPSMANVRVEDVQCLTSKRIMRIEGLCNLSNNIDSRNLFKIFTYNP